MEMVLFISTSLPNSFAPASAPSTISRLIAEAKIRMNIDDNKKYAINVQRAAASRMTSSMLAMRTFMLLSFCGRELYHEKQAWIRDDGVHCGGASCALTRSTNTSSRVERTGAS